MEKDKLMQLLKDTYNSGYEDGLVKGANGVECNNFDDVIYENISTINELCKSKINLNKETLKGLFFTKTDRFWIRKRDGYRFDNEECEMAIATYIETGKEP